MYKIQFYKTSAKKESRRAYKLYDSRYILDTFKAGLDDDVFIRCLDSDRVKIYDDEMEEIRRKQAESDELDRKIGLAAKTNNEGQELETAGDIAGAIAKYEENILPDTYFTLKPYRRLCILYRKAGDYDNEIRVIETCLARPEWNKKQYAGSKEHTYFADKLTKAKSYQSKSK